MLLCLLQMKNAYEYIKYLLISQGRHAFHSPFVYDFKDKCLKMKMDFAFLEKQEKQLYSLKKDDSVFEMKDFGAGSRKMERRRQVNEVFKNAATKGVFLEVLSQISLFYKPEKILELGTSLGVGTFALTSGGGLVVTVDACDKTQAFARKYFPLVSSEVRFVNDTFDHFISRDSSVYDLIFIDGHHDGTSLKRYLKQLQKNSHEETIFILDDIRWNRDMLRAWTEIIEDRDYHLSMDLFKFGIVMKRPHQQKQHFVVRLNGILRSLL